MPKKLPAYLTPPKRSPIVPRLTPYSIQRCKLHVVVHQRTDDWIAEAMEIAYCTFGRTRAEAVEPFYDGLRFELAVREIRRMWRPTSEISRLRTLLKNANGVSLNLVNVLRDDIYGHTPFAEIVYVTIKHDRRVEWGKYANRGRRLPTHRKLIPVL